jgi:purine-binding chemotaxis protein CheW
MQGASKSADVVLNAAVDELTPPELQLVSFAIGEEEFGLEIVRVQEIIRMQPITRVPNSPSFVEGVINLRGKVIPILSLRKRLGLDARAADRETRIIIANVSGVVLGFIVDRVCEVMRIASEMVEAPPRLTKVAREYVAGVGRAGERLLILLDMERLITEPETTSAAELAHA